MYKPNKSFDYFTKLSNKYTNIINLFLTKKQKNITQINPYCDIITYIL